MYGIRALPSYLIEYNKKQLVVSGVFSYGEMVRHIQTVTNNAIQAKSVPFSEKTLSKIMEAHPHIHYLELRNAFDLTDSSVLDTALKQWQIEGIIDKELVKESFFIRYKK